MSGIPIRIGIVSDTFPDLGMVSVTFPQLDGATTGKLLLFSYTDEYKVPRVGDTVLVLMLTNSKGDGIVLGKLWSEKNKPPDPGDHIFKKELSHDYGKAYIRYDDEADELIIHAGKIRIEAAKETMVLEAKEDLTLETKAAATMKSADTMTLKAGAPMTLQADNITLNDSLTTNTGDYTTPKDVTAEGVSLKNHTHAGGPPPDK